MRKQNVSTLVGQASLFKLWNTPKTDQSVPPTDEPNEAGIASEDESTLSQASRSKSDTRARGGDLLPLNNGELSAGREKASGRSRKSKRELNNTKSNLNGSQTKLSAMFQPRPATGQRGQQQESAKDTSRGGDSGDEQISTKNLQLKRNNSVPLRSLPPTESVLPSPLSQPVVPTTAIIDISDESSDCTSSVPNGSRKAPITVDLSPQKAIPFLKQAKSSKPPPSSFFTPRRKSYSAPKVPVVGEGSHAIYPATPDEQHARGPQRSFHRTSLVLPPSGRSARERRDEELLTSDLSWLKLQLSNAELNVVSYGVEPLGIREGSHAVGQSILESHEANPAFAKFLCPDHDIMGLFWNERWHPRCAAEVLGNMDHAFFLRDWLLALEIRDSGKAVAGSIPNSVTSRNPATVQKRPAIIRSVTKPRKRRRVDSDEDDLNGWMVSDDEDEAEEREEDDEDEMDLRFTTPVFDHEDTCGEGADGGSPWKPKRTRITRRRPPDSARSVSPAKEESLFRVSTHDFSERLSNCILLVGPPGVGKTAAVYACAEELGWEVFEVYPGIGKRNGSSLLSLVGDVTKNHIVKRGSAPMAQETSSRSGKVSNFFQSKSRDVMEDFALVATPMIGPSANDTDPEPKGPQQSIILLEEVDVLFSEDGGFWQTVVTLIRESRRPVVMTCNDPTLVPISTLPLQEVLNFKPASMDDASAYLQCMMLSIGCTSSIEHMRALYRSDGNTEALDAADTLLRSHIPSADVSPPDLRQAINNLQFLCEAVPGFDHPIPAPRQTEVAEELMAGTLRLEEAFDVFGSSISKRLANQDTPEKVPSMQKLWRISETLSAVESQLGRSPSIVLETHSLGNEVKGDEELGYIRLEPDIGDAHQQDGITFFNCDDAITIEACESAKMVIGAVTSSTRLGRSSAHHPEARAQPKGHRFLYDRGEHMTRTMNLMNKLVSLPSRQSLDSLFLDYEPWTRAIDRSDSKQERIAVGEAEMRAGNNGGRMTRNSNRAVYVRYFDLGNEERRAWQENGLEPMAFVGE